MKKTVLILTLIMFSVIARAQTAVDLVSKETCNCLGKLDFSVMSAADIDTKFQGCLATSLIVHNKELKKSKNFDPENPTEEQINGLVQDIYKTCPTTMAKLREREAYLEKTTVILSKQELIDQSVANSCECMVKKGGKSDDFSSCMKVEMEKNQPSITAAYGDDMFTAIFGFMFDVTFLAMDRCEQASKVLFEGRAANYKDVGGNCSELAKTSGDYFYDAQYVGRTNVKFTPTTYQELDDKGKEKSSNAVVWTGCTANLIELKDGVMAKKGDTTKLLVKRASPEGFVCILKFAKIQTMVEYRKAK